MEDRAHDAMFRTVAKQKPHCRATSLLAPVFALFVPFYRSIPRVQVAQILGPVTLTNKTLIYILGLQLFTSGSYIWIVAISGLVSGVCYNSKVLRLQQVLCVPSGVARFFSCTLEPIFSSAEPTAEARVGMGATVDIQRQQRVELLDRQLMLSQFAQARRQRQQQTCPLQRAPERAPRARVLGAEGRQDHCGLSQGHVLEPGAVAPPPTDSSTCSAARAREQQPPALRDEPSLSPSVAEPRSCLSVLPGRDLCLAFRKWAAHQGRRGVSTKRRVYTQRKGGRVCPRPTPWWQRGLWTVL
ncbi:Ubiquitin-associated domain-containing protein 2 [Galemys pyrenaicus]|uniref:Ubiquitin-associated domain-containing protein 2 n=1 Tax=Galemys pyrenaicus TaxID=202257 RepID=A0A8J6DSR8_GALPY|nr:Ubiquitin-associated domain-containing protein 2 [Galemys pyrenaicus]